MLSVTVLIVAIFSGLVWWYGLAIIHMSHETHLHQQQCTERDWGPLRCVQHHYSTTEFSWLYACPHSRWYNNLIGKNSSRHNVLPVGFYSGVCTSVRTDGSHGEMGGNVWYLTMPTSSERRCKGQGVEVRNQLQSKIMRGIIWPGGRGIQIIHNS